VLGTKGFFAQSGLGLGFDQLRHLFGAGFSGHFFTFDRKGQARKLALQDGVARTLTYISTYFPLPFIIYFFILMLGLIWISLFGLLLPNFALYFVALQPALVLKYGWQVDHVA